MMNIHSSPLLRQALVADATTSAAFGLLMLIGAGPLSGVFGLPETLLRIAGLVLLPYAAFIGWLGLRETIGKPVAWAVVLGNALWVARQHPASRERLGVADERRLCVRDRSGARGADVCGVSVCGLAAVAGSGCVIADVSIVIPDAAGDPGSRAGCGTYSLSLRERVGVRVYRSIRKARNPSPGPKGPTSPSGRGEPAPNLSRDP